MTKDCTTVLVFGTFDVIHPGHKWFLRHAARQGDRLIAAIARDEFINEWKGRSPVLEENARMKALKVSGLVDSTILSDKSIRTYGVVLDVKPDIICLGHDQKALKDDLESWLSAHNEVIPTIMVLPPWKRNVYSSTRRNSSLRGAGSSEYSSPWGLYLLMVIAMGTFGFSWVSGKRISGYAVPAVLASIRFALTALCFVPLFLAQRPKALNKEEKKGWLWTGLAGLTLSIYNLLFFGGLNAGLAGQGGLLVTTLNPLFTSLIVTVLSRQIPRRGGFVGIVIGICGGILLLQPWRYTFGELFDSGNIAFLGAALSWSILTIVSRKAQSLLGFRRFNLGLYIIGAALMYPVALITGGVAAFSHIPGSWDFWGNMIFISAATGAFGTGAYFMASSKLGATRGSAFTYLVPVFALVFTSVMLNESVDLWMIAGGILAIIAVLLINKKN